jgi:hypothetical protein
MVQVLVLGHCHFSTVSFRLEMDACAIQNIYSKKTFQEKRILYIKLDLNKTYVTKMYGTTNIKYIL